MTAPLQCCFALRNFKKFDDANIQYQAATGMVLDAVKKDEDTMPKRAKEIDETWSTNMKTFEKYPKRQNASLSRSSTYVAQIRRTNRKLKMRFAIDGHLF